MSNDCCGTMKVVSKDKMTLERLKKIMNYEDNEYCLYRCKQCDEWGEPYKDGDYWVQDFNVDGAWSCDPFFEYGNRPDTKLIVKQTFKDGKFENEYGTQHFTDLTYLAEKLGFGAELYCCEGGMGFCQHFCVNHNGEYDSETGDYRIEYPMKGDDIDYDAEPTEEFGIEDYMEFGWASEIYGD